MRFLNQKQRDVFSSCCKGNLRRIGSLPSHLAEEAKLGKVVHDARGANGGLHQDPLAIRAKWPSFEQCSMRPEQIAFLAIVGRTGYCKCRFCRLRRAAERIRKWRVDADHKPTRRWILTHVAWLEEVPKSAFLAGMSALPTDDR